jgi:hypothetical protein
MIGKVLLYILIYKDAVYQPKQDMRSQYFTDTVCRKEEVENKLKRRT